MKANKVRQRNHPRVKAYLPAQLKSQDSKYHLKTRRRLLITGKAGKRKDFHLKQFQKNSVLLHLFANCVSLKNK
jgi:hypothetical protein